MGGGFGIACYVVLSVLELLPSSAKLSCTQRTRVNNFQRLFVVAVQLSLPRWPVRLQSESGVPVFLKKYFYLF